MNDDNDDNDSMEYDVGDALGKVLALVTQVCCHYIAFRIPFHGPQIRRSPQARAFFKQSCREVDIPTLELLTWIRTCWASLFNFLDRILMLKLVRNS